jgi:hypothetical protein
VDDFSSVFTDFTGLPQIVLASFPILIAPTVPRKSADTRAAFSQGEKKEGRCCCCLRASSKILYPSQFACHACLACQSSWGVTLLGKAAKQQNDNAIARTKNFSIRGLLSGPKKSQYIALSNYYIGNCNKEGGPHHIKSTKVH